MIRVREVSKRYPRNRPPASLKAAVLRGGFRRMFRPPGWNWALRDVSVDVQPGAAVALVGPNGAGKSTLLRLLGGVGRPDQGTIELRGRVGALLELGSAFHHELTGRENAVTAAVVAGVDRREAERRLSAVSNFAELDDVLDEPLRIYSDGMRARLAFAVAAHVDADVLLVDELLAVGDLAFQDRCIAYLKKFRTRGGTLVMASHDAGLVGSMCDDVVWLQGGRVAAQGPAGHTIEQYVRAMEERTRAATPTDLTVDLTDAGVELVPRINRVGTQVAMIEGVRLLDAWGSPCATIRSGDGLRVQISTKVPPRVGAVNIGVRLCNDDGALCAETSTAVGPDEAVMLELRRLDLAPGVYAFDVGLYSTDWSETFDHHHRAYGLVVAGPPSRAVLSPPHLWRRERSTVPSRQP